MIDTTCDRRIRPTIIRRDICLALAVAFGMSIATWAGGAAAQDLTEVRIGTTNTSTDIGFYLADKKGYFKEEGIKPSFIPFNSAANMVAPLGIGQLDVGAGAPSSALYNAVARGINIRIVADKGSTPPGYGVQPLLVRKDLVDSGKVKSLADLKGLKIASGAIGISTSSTLNEALKKGGLTMRDVNVVAMGYPQHVMALQNGAVDASMTTEPSATVAVANGSAVRFMNDDVIYPNHQLSVVLYSGIFIKNSQEIARKFMRAYVRGIRDYNSALKDGRISGPNAEEVISILVEYTKVKDANIYRTISAHGTNPDGWTNRASLQKDFEFFKEQGLLEGKVTVDDVVDNSFVESTVKKLGTYKRPGP